MSTLQRKLWRELCHSAGLIIAIGAIIAVGVCCYVLMTAAHANLTVAKRDYYQQCHMADFWIDLKKAPVAAVRELEQVPGVMEVRPRIQSKVTLDFPHILKPINAQLFSLPAEPKPVINNIVMVSGSYFTKERMEEVIVNHAFARHHKLYPGSTFKVLLNNRQQELFVVGTAISSEFVYVAGPGSLVPDRENFGILYLKQQYLEEALNFDGACNQVVGTLAPTVREQPEEILDRLERKLDAYGVFTTTKLSEQASNHFLSNEIEQLGAFSVLLPGIFLAVAALVLNMLLSRLVEHQRTIIGTLKAIGYTNGELLWHYLQFGIFVGLLGGLIGALAGYYSAGLLTESVYRQFFEFPTLENRFHPSQSLTGILISVACGAIGAFTGVRSILLLQPAEAMRPKPPRKGGAVFLEHWTWFWQQLDTSWRMVFRNVIRNRGRTAIGIFAAAMGAGLLSVSLMGTAALEYLIDFQFEKVLRSDVDLIFKNEVNRSGLYEARNLPGVDLAEPQLDVPCTFYFLHREKRSAVTGLEAYATLTVPRDLEGEAVTIPPTGLVMGKALADILGVKPGDMVTLKPIKGLRQPRQARVEKVTDGYLGLSCYANIEYLSQLIGEEYVLTGVQLKINPEPESRTEFYRHLKQLPALEGYSSRADLIRNLVKTLLETNYISLGIMLMFSGVIFFGSTLNAGLIGLAEREREVATMLVLGYAPGTISQLFWRESLLVNAVGTLVGLPLGYLLMIGVAEGFNNELARIPVMMPLDVCLYTLATGIVFTLLAHWVVRRRINKLDWQESLKVKE